MHLFLQVVILFFQLWLLKLYSFDHQSGVSIILLSLKSSSAIELTIKPSNFSWKSCYFIFEITDLVHLNLQLILAERIQFKYGLQIHGSSNACHSCQLPFQFTLLGMALLKCVFFTNACFEIGNYGISCFLFVNAVDNLIFQSCQGVLGSFLLAHFFDWPTQFI